MGIDYDKIPTERLNPRAEKLGRLSASAALRLMDGEDARMLAAVRRAGPAVARGVELIVKGLSAGGRLFFAGAGTSGRLGVLEAAECPPTFGTAPSLVQALMAGGKASVFRSREGAEDRGKEAADLVRRKVRRGDVLVGVTASGVTAFVREALKAARRRGAATVLVTCNPSVPKNIADAVIAAATGPEVVAGSTRLKAGTATKIILNRLTTLAMVRLGRTSGPYMANLQPRSKKLIARAKRLVRLGVRKNIFTLLLLLAAGAGAARAQVLTGLDVLEKHDFADLKGRRVGVICNRASVDARGRNVVDLLAGRKDLTLAAIFTPEHGFTGRVEAGFKISDSTHSLGIPIYSLYGQVKRPTPEMLKGLDALVFDLQDVGARFYTYITTLGYALEAADGAGLELVVLDRPNPLGGEVVEGEILDNRTYNGFTAYYPFPVRHGMTVGEIARFHKDQVYWAVRLVVIPMEGWSRSLLWRDTGLPFCGPSPNIRNPEAALLYAGLGAFEATNLDVGRGTGDAFRVMKAPWLDGPKLAARLNALALPGVSFSSDRNTVFIDVRDARVVRPVDIFVHTAWLLREIHPADFHPRWREMPLVTGSLTFETLFKGGAPVDVYLKKIHADAGRFSGERASSLLYE